MNVIKILKGKKKLAQQATNQIAEAEAQDKAIAEEKKLYEEKRKVLVQEYKALYPTAIIIIKDFQDYGTHFSFTQTIQTRSLYSKLYYERYATNNALETELKNIKLINNSVDEEIHNLYEKQGVDFYKSNKEYSYYHSYERTAIYLNEHDWNILTGKTK